MLIGAAYPFPALSAPLRFAFAAGTVVTVILIDRTFPSLVDDGSQFLMLGTAVVCSAWLGGVGPSLLAVVMGALLGSQDATGEAGATHLALFVIHGLLLTAIVTELRYAHRLADRQARDAQQARQVSEAAARIKDEFLATISHELRTPLNAILGWTQLIRNGHLDAPTRQRGLDSIERNVRQQAQVTGDLLDASRSMTGLLKLDCRPASLCEAVREATETARIAAQAKQISIDTNVVDSPMVLGDSMRLRQIAWHLLFNALKFTPRGGRIALSVDLLDDRVRLMVADSGPGMSAEFLPRVFDRFTQEDASPTRTAAGLGVGLSLVRDLVQMHGGEIEARNGVGGGAVFTVLLPLLPGSPPVAQPAPPQARASADDRLQGIRVLVFDTDADGRDVLQMLLREHGAAVQTAESLAEALESLEGWRPDVLVRQTPLPDGDSYSVVGRSPSSGAERGGRIPALALTSLPRDNPDVSVMFQDSIHQLRKPLEPAMLTAAVARLSRRQLESARH